MSCRRIREEFEERFGGAFAEPAYSADNAAGIALLCEEKHRYEISEGGGAFEDQTFGKTIGKRVEKRYKDMNLPENQKILTVADLNGYVKGLLEADPRLQGVYVKGEISNFKNHTSGHFYFTLKDAGGAVSAVMFRSAAAKLRFLPENGMRVIVRGRVSLFPQAGSYQLYADGMEPDGVGALYIAYEQLRRRLEAEGLFRQDRKRPLPKIPSCVGVITSLRALRCRIF